MEITSLNTSATCQIFLDISVLTLVSMLSCFYLQIVSQQRMPDISQMVTWEVLWETKTPWLCFEFSSRVLSLWKPFFIALK